MKSVMPERSEGEARPLQSNVVWRRISERIEQRLAVVERAIAALLDGSLSASDASTARAEASLLCDWLFALDLVVAGRLARDIADSFDGAPEPTSAASVATVVDRLRTVVRVAETEWADVEGGTARVHFVSGANAQIDAVAWHLQQNGVDITYSPTFFSAPDDVDVLVVMSPHPTDALQLLNTVRQRSTTITRALVHPGDVAIDQLLRVAPAVELMLRYDAAPMELANQILMAIRPTQRAWGQVVLHGANALYPQLRAVGFHGLIADDSRALVHALDSGARVVVIGPEAQRRAELVKLLRATPASRSTIIAVVAETPTEHEQCLRAGADIVIGAEQLADTWAAQLRALSTAQDQASGVVTDESTPLPSGQRAWVLLERAINEVQRGRGTATLAVVHLPPLGASGTARVQRLLDEEFRHDDTVAAIGEQHVAAVLRGASLEEAQHRLERALDAVEIPADPGTVGLAAFPDDGLGVKALVDAAAAAAERSRAAEGPAVVDSGWFAGIETRLDVLIVESDPTLARLLERLLTKDGYDVSIVGTGSAALSTLTGPNAIAPPRLVLLELDAMGADGMMILRSLVRARVLEQSGVVVTCSLLNDGQLREAFELGAIDVLTKPFSSVVLRNRIERALAQ